MVLTNYWAVLVAAIVAFIVGWLWHGPLFGSTWMRLMGMNPEDCKEMPKGMWKTMLLGFFSMFVMAWCLDYSLAFAQVAMKASNTQIFIQGAFWNWLGFISVVTLSGVLWEKRSWKLWCFNNAYWLVELLIIGAILVNWR